MSHAGKSFMANVCEQAGFSQGLSVCVDVFKRGIKLDMLCVRWCVFSPDAAGPSLSLSLSLRQRTSFARRRNTIVTRLRLPPLSPGFHVASVFIKHL